MILRPRACFKKAGLSGLFFIAAWVTCSFGAGVVAAEALMLEVSNARVAYDSRTNEPVVSFRLTPSSQRLFASFTQQNVGKRVALRVDGRVISSPVIREPITGGTGQLSGSLTAADAKDIAARLSSGAAKIEIEAVPD